MPLQTGLYCALLPAVLFAVIASSRQLVVGADSATAALVAAGAGFVATAGTTQYVGAVAVLGLLTALFLLVMAVAKLGFLADLISQPVLAGFLSGVGVSLIIGKLPGMLELPSSGTTWDKLVDTVQGLGDINVTSALLSVGVVVTILAAERLVPKLPAALLAVVGFSVVAQAIGAQAKGVSMVGSVPAGLPSFSLPGIEAGELASLAQTAAAIAIVILAQSAAVARSFATKNGYHDDTNQDLYAFAAANAGSAVTGGFAINGSPPRTAAGDSAGSHSQLVNLVMAAMIALILLFATGLFAYLPHCVLDAVVFAIGVGLIKVGRLKAVARSRKAEFVTAIVCLVVVAFVGVQQGVLLAVIVSLIDRLRRQYAPHDDVLARDGEIADRLKARVGQQHSPGLIVYRFGAGLFFENASHFDARVRAVVEEARVPVHTVVLDAAAMDDIDYTGADVLRRPAAGLRARKGTRLVITELSPAAGATLERTGLGEVLSVVPRLESAVGQTP